MVYKEDYSNDYLFGSENNKPTHLAYLIKESGESDSYYYYICDKKAKKSEGCMSAIAKEDVFAIRRFAQASATVHKSIAGSIIKSIGGLGASFGGFLKISIGDNDSVKQAIEALAVTTTKRVTESLMTKALISERDKCNTQGKGWKDCDGMVSLIVKEMREIEGEK